MWPDAGRHNIWAFHYAVSNLITAIPKDPVKIHIGDEPFVFSLSTQNQIAFNEHFIMAEITAKLGYDLSYWETQDAYEELRTYGALAA